MKYSVIKTQNLPFVSPTRKKFVNRIFIPMSCCCCRASETAKAIMAANAKCRVTYISENKSYNNKLYQIDEFKIYYNNQFIISFNRRFEK